MKKNRSRKYLAIFGLLIFSLGQVLLYGHNHIPIVSCSKDVALHTGVGDKVAAKCALCDMASHCPMLLSHIEPSYSLISIEFKWIDNLKQYKGNFYIQTDGLSPPSIA